MKPWRETLRDFVYSSKEQIARLTKPRHYMNGWDKGPITYMVWKDGGTRHTHEFEYPWYFYVYTRDYLRHQELFDKLKISNLVYFAELYPMDHGFTRVYCRNGNLSNSAIEDGEASQREIVLEALKTAGIRTFEADLPSLKRLMLDCEIKISNKYKVLFFDIETQDEDEYGRRLPINVGAYPVLSCAFETMGGGKTFLCHDEEEVLLWDIYKMFEAADIVVGYNSKKFDIPYLRERGAAKGIYFPLKRLIHVDFFERIFDLYQFDQTIEQYGLDYISNHFLPGERKIAHTGLSIYRMFLNQLEGSSSLFREYNEQDVRLLRLLNQKLDLLPFMVQVAQLTGSFLSQFHKSWLIDSFILRRGMIQGRPLPSKERHIKTDKFDGAEVLECVPGRYKDVFVFDFKSLYPNVIRSWNIGSDGDSLVESPTCPGKGFSLSATPHTKVWFDQERQSMLADAVSLFLDGRAEVRARMKGMDPSTPEYAVLDRTQQTWKILANSSYGITASPVTRYFDKRVAESITHGGRTMLHLAMEWFNGHGHKVIYGDTDSVFVLLRGITVDEALKQIHVFFAQALSERWGIRKSTIELEYEKQYSVLALLGKKHYCGILEGGKKHGQFDGKGMDFKKRSTIPFTRKMLEDLMNSLLHTDKDATDYGAWLAKIRSRMIRGEISSSDLSLFAIQKKMGKEPDSFDASKALPIHVQIYKDLKKAGFEVWIPYVVRYVLTVPDGTREGNTDGQAVELFPSSGKELDRVAYWQTEIYSKLVRILEAIFPEFDWLKYDLIEAPKRKKKIEDLTDKLKNTTNIRTWWKAYKDTIHEKTFTKEMRKQILRDSNSENEEVQREKRLLLDNWVSNRVINAYKDDVSMIDLHCTACRCETPHHRGSRDTKNNKYTSTLCTGCGKETSEKKAVVQLWH